VTSAFYPYVFLAARSAFSSISSDYLETSESLGKGKFHTFYRITLPLSRPAIIGGLMLVCLETLNEYGAMKILGIETLMTEVFRIRAGTNDLNTALRVSGCLMCIVFVLLAIELILRGRKQYVASRSSTLSESAPIASKSRLVVIYSVSLTVLFFCFILPMSELLRQAYHGTNKASFSDYTGPILDSVLLASQASILVIIIAVFLSYAQRKFPNLFFKVTNKLCSLGYALPGAILGVVLVTWVGSSLNSSISPLIETLFYGSTYGLVIAYAIRFLAIGINPCEAGYSQIPKTLDEASLQLGKNNFTTFIKVHLPLLKPSLIAGFLILFIDVLKELPLTLIMQPFDTETLAMQTYALFATQEEFALGSIPALILIFTGIIGMVAVKLILKPKSRLS